MLIETDPDTFWQTPHYADWPGVLVRYGTADAERIATVIARAWWDRAPRRSAQAFGDAALTVASTVSSRSTGRAQAVARPKAWRSRWPTPARRRRPRLVARRRWSREDVLDWLLRHRRRRRAMLIGLDLSPGFPFADAAPTFPAGPNSPPDARALWALVDAHVRRRPASRRRRLPRASRGRALFPPARRATRRPVRRAAAAGCASASAAQRAMRAVAVELLQPGRRGAGRQVEPDRHARPPPARRPHPGLAVRSAARDAAR